MTQVDPFIHPIPPKIQNDPELRPFFEYFVRWAHDMWVRSGGGNDLIDSAAKRESYAWDLNNSTDKQDEPIFNWDVNNALEKQNTTQYNVERVEKEIITKTILNETYTSVGNEFVVCKGKCTVKLPENPGENCVVYIHNYDNEMVSIEGNGREINQNDMLFIRRKGNGLQIYYFIDDNEYIAI